MIGREALIQLLQRWRADAMTLRQYADERGAIICESHADELESALAAEADELLTLAAAAAESGFSTDHLGRLVRAGSIPNAGRPHAPRIRRADLPRKANALPVKSVRCNIAPASKEQIARAVVTQFRGGNDG